MLDNSLKFSSDGKLRIMVVSDPQDLKFIRPSMVYMLNTAYDNYKPDVVLFNGDNILGNHLLDARIGSRKVAEGKEATLAAMTEALYKLLKPVDDRGIPFAMVYGNHDDMNLLTKEEQIEIYRSYKNCMQMNVSDDSVDCDTFVIKIYSPNGKLAFAVYMLDSAWQDKIGERHTVTEIKKETVDWFEKTSAALREENGGKPVPAVMLMHIPLPEINELLEECGKDDIGSVEVTPGVYKRLNSVKAKGYLKENPSVSDNENGLFEKIKADSGVKAIVFGHDHTNCFEGEVDGIKIWQTGAASFRCYGSSDTKGVRLIDIDESGNVETKFLTYYDIVGKTPVNKFRYVFDADEYAVKKFTTLGALAAVALTAAGIKTYKKLKK